MDHLHYPFYASRGDTIEVTLDKQANVLLLDSSNYQHYCQNRQYNYFGGLAKVSPVHLSVPSTGNWHVVIDLGGGSGQIKASARLI